MDLKDLRPISILVRTSRMAWEQTRNGHLQKGRGAGSNSSGRFESKQTEIDEEGFAIRTEFNDGFEAQSKTQFLRDRSQTILSENDSPDIGFRYSVNPYRGCEHGCAYCYARPTHEYLGYSAGLDFETKIFVKEQAAELLRNKLMSRNWRPEPIFFSGVTDCYQPAERKFLITRKCLEILAQFQNPLGIITKNRLVTRDIDILSALASKNLCLVILSVTTLDHELAKILEPRTSAPAARLEAIRELSAAGIRVGVNVAPVIPGLNDHEIPAILQAAAKAGAKFAHMTPIRLPLSVLPLFNEWLENHRPERKEKILNSIRSIRSCRLNSSEFGSRMRGEGPIADSLRALFRLCARRENLNREKSPLSTEHFCRPGDQLTFL